MYESKASIRSEFEQFQKMFFLLGGVLCAIIGLVGILNFLNAIMMGILARKREFAALGWLIPSVLYQAGSRQSIVERLREAE